MNNKYSNLNVINSIFKKIIVINYRLTNFSSRIIGNTGPIGLIGPIGNNGIIEKIIKK